MIVPLPITTILTDLVILEMKIFNEDNRKTNLTRELILKKKKVKTSQKAGFVDDMLSTRLMMTFSSIMAYLMEKSQKEISLSNTELDEQYLTDSITIRA